MALFCPLCNADKIKFLFNKQQNPHYRCRECGFVFSKPATNANLQNQLEDFEPAYINYLSEQAHDQKNHEALVKKLSKHASLAGANILDVGSGSGKLVRYLRGQGMNAQGLEPSAALYQAYLQNEPFFFHGDIFEFAEKHAAGKFDAVIAADVLEHVADPLSFISGLAGLLRGGGLLFISTPDTGSVFARIAGKRWHYYNRYHLSLFSTRNLGKVGAMQGLTLLAAGHVTRYQSLYYIIKYGWNFLLQTDKGVPTSLQQLHLPVNLYDNQFAVFRR